MCCCSTRKREFGGKASSLFVSSLLLWIEGECERGCSR